MTVLRTFCGVNVDLASPVAEDILLRDIAHHLALISRFNGATALPYSVAQHSCLAAHLAERKHKDPLLALQVLLHDGHEYVSGDIARPVQMIIGAGRRLLKSIQQSLDTAIHDALRVPMPDAAAKSKIEWADDTALATEWRDLMPGPAPEGLPAPAAFSVKPIAWHAAEEKFLKEFERLSLLAHIAATS